jgi:putative transposase
MGRPVRNSLGGYVFHVLCSCIQAKGFFRCEQDYEDFDRVLSEAIERFEPRLMAYCLLPKHWHLVITPRQDGDLSKFMGWLTTTHSMRWHAKPRRFGTGGLYERRFKSFPVQEDASLLDVMQFVESRSLRNGLVSRAEDWQWSSLSGRQPGRSSNPMISMPPIALPSDWLRQVNSPIDPAAESRVLHSIQRGSPLGTDAWKQRTAERMNLESTLRPRGRPRTK